LKQNLKIGKSYLSEYCGIDVAKDGRISPLTGKLAGGQNNSGISESLINCCERGWRNWQTR